MKTRKAIAILSAAVMSLCALPMASVSAADAAVPGDVDGDGKITSMDTAGILTLAAYAGALDGDFSAAFAEAFHGNYFFGA